MTTHDLAIIGAGAAGLAAARTARNRGLDVVVLEALDRIGGRAQTDQTTFGVPWDRGCHWLHSASINPLRALADDLGIRYERGNPPYRVWLGDRWATETERSTHLAYAETAHADAIAAGKTGQDVPVSSLLDPNDPADALFQIWFNANWGTTPERASTLDAANYRDTDENWPVSDGYGTLVARLGAGGAVELATPVSRIAWNGAGVAVTTPRGTIQARAAIITVSTGVLAAKTIVFDPPLPDWKQSAAEAVPLGTANKVVFAIDGRHLGVAEPTGIVVPLPGITDGWMTFRLRPFGRDLADGYLAGPSGRILEEAGEAATIETARDALANALGSASVRQITASACTRWGAEPSILGAYAAALPGQAHRRADLARPVANRLFFAGEATSPDFFTTCHGAHLSGIAAAEAAIAAIRPSI